MELKASFIFFTIFSSHIAAAAGSSPPSQSCQIVVSPNRFESLMNQYAPRGSNGRGSAAAIYRIGGSGELVQKIYEKNSNVAQAVASTQKIVTAYVASKYGNLSQKITFTADDLDYDKEGIRAVYPGTGRQVQVGEQVKLSELMNTLLVQSSNGAGQAIARGVASGDVRKFVGLMNQESKTLLQNSGVNSYFQNPHGLTDSSSRYRFGSSGERQRSTANNMARLIGAMMSQSQFKSNMGRIGLRDASKGNLKKVGATAAAGRTIVMHFSLPTRGCKNQGIAMAFFGDGTSTQLTRLHNLTAAVREEILSSLGASRQLISEEIFTLEFEDEILR